MAVVSVLLTVSLAVPPDVSGQRLNIRRYSWADDVPHGQIYAIHQGRHGYIWVASNAGFGRYDGRQFHPTTAEQGLASNSVMLLDELPGGDIVAGTSAGVCRVAREGIRCVGQADGLVRNQLRDLHVDPDSSIWVAADGGVSLIRGDRVVRSYWEADGLPSTEAFAITRDGAGTLWAGTASGLARLEGETWTRVPMPEGAGVRATALAWGPLGLLLGTDRGLYRRDEGGWQQIPLEGGPDGVRLLSFGPDGTLWIGGLRTLHRYLDGVDTKYTAAHGLPTQDLWDMEVDREGNVWLGSDEGLAKIVPGPFEFYTEAQGLPHPFVRALAATSEGDLWFGTREGLAKWTGDGMDEVPFAGLVPDERIYSMAAGPDRSLLLGTAQGLIHRSEAGRMRTFLPADGLPHAFVRALLPDTADGAWVGTASGVVRWTRDGIAEVDSELLSRAPALSLAHDSIGRLWVGLSSEGLYVVEDDSVRLMGAEQGLSDQAIWSMAADPSGGMWIGTNGDGAFHISDGGIRQVTQTEGLGDNFVWQVEVDSRGDTWFFTGSGLNRLRGDRMTYYGTADGLEDLEGAAAAVLEDGSGDLWFGAGNGVYRFQPSEAREHPLPPPVTLEGVSVGGTSVPPEALDLPPRPGAISFRFSVPSYSDERGMRFRHRLAGIDEDWSEALADPVVSFARLGHGRYTLEVVAETHQGNRGAEVLVLPFSVRPAIWETWWFRGLVILLIASVVVSAPFLRARRLEAERMRLESLVADRTGEIEEKNLRLEKEIEERERTEQAKSELESQLWEAQKMEVVGRLAGGVAHDFNNLLSVVLGHAELLAEDVPRDSALRDGLEEIRSSANQGAELVSRLLAFSQKQITRREPLNLAETTRDSVVVLRRLLEGKVDLSTNVPDDLPCIEGDRVQLNQVLVNLALNAKDAMPTGGSMHIGLRLAEVHEPISAPFSNTVPEGRYAVMTVSDTGVGMDEETLGCAFEPFFTTRPVGEGSGLGLSTVYGIVEMHNGYLQVRSTPGEGTEFDIYFPEHVGTVH